MSARETSSCCSWSTHSFILQTQTLILNTQLQSKHIPQKMWWKTIQVCHEDSYICESYWKQFAVWKSYSKCDLMTGAFNMHVLKIAQSSYKWLNIQLVHCKQELKMNNLVNAQKTLSFRANTKRFEHKHVYLRNGFRDRLLFCKYCAFILKFVWPYLIVWTKQMAHLFDQDDTKIDQASHILNKPGHIKHSRRRVVQTQRSYEWKRHLYLETISRHMQNKNIS